LHRAGSSPSSPTSPSASRSRWRSRTACTASSSARWSPSASAVRHVSSRAARRERRRLHSYRAS